MGFLVSDILMGFLASEILMGFLASEILMGFLASEILMGFLASEILMGFLASEIFMGFLASKIDCFSLMSSSVNLTVAYQLYSNNYYASLSSLCSSVHLCVFIFLQTQKGWLLFGGRIVLLLKCKLMKY